MAPASMVVSLLIPDRLALIAVAINTVCAGPVFLPLSFEVEIGGFDKKFRSAVP